MKTMKINKMPVAMVLAAFWGLLLAATTASAAWTSIAYDETDPWGGLNMPRVNAGANTDGYYYTSAKPGTGAWTFHYEFRPVAQDAGWTTLPMSVWSADNAWFHTFSTSSANGGAAADVQIKVVLSEAITGAAWTPRPSIDITGTGGLSAYSEYSTNGLDWTTAATYSVDGLYEGTNNLSFAPTTELYLRLRADGGGVYYSLTYGDVAFTAAPIPEPMTLALLGLGSLACLRRRNRN